MYLSRLSGCLKSSQRDAPSSGISLLGTKSNQQVQNWRVWRVVEHSHFLLGQKLLDDGLVVGWGIVVQKEPVTRFTHVRFLSKVTSVFLAYLFTQTRAFKGMFLCNVECVCVCVCVCVHACFFNY